MKLPSLNLKSLSFLRYGAHLEPYRDWFAIIAISLVLFILSGAWNVWLFYRVATGQNLGTTASSTSETLDISSLSRASGVFKMRAEEAARYRNEYRFVDPSK